MAIITRAYALKLIKAGKAETNGVVFADGNDTTPTHVVVTRFDSCRVDHYAYTDADAPVLAAAQTA